MYEEMFVPALFGQWAPVLLEAGGTTAGDRLLDLLAPGGTVALATWAELGHSPGFAALVELFDRELGRDAGDALRAPFSIGTPADLAAAVEAAFPGVVAEERPGLARFGSLDEWVGSELKGWTLAADVDDEAVAGALEAARSDLTRFAAADGTVTFPVPALVAVGANVP